MDIGNKINIAELLKDCPKGMELYSPIFGELKFNEVNAINNRILVVQQNGYIAEFESDGRLINCKNGECLLFPSKGKTTWEGFQRPFMDGDVLSYQYKGYKNRTIYIYMQHSKMNTTYYVALSGDSDSRFMINDKEGHALNSYDDSVRLATEEEKAKLFQAIKDNGYKWNHETKTLEKFTPDKFDINTLKPFDKVLVRDNNEQFWTCDWFSFHDTKQVYPFACVGHYVSQCIPYEENQHLLGTTDDCDEYFKTW